MCFCLRERKHRFIYLTKMPNIDGFLLRMYWIYRCVCSKCIGIIVVLLLRLYWKYGCTSVGNTLEISMMLWMYQKYRCWFDYIRNIDLFHLKIYWKYQSASGPEAENVTVFLDQIYIDNCSSENGNYKSVPNTCSFVFHFQIY